MSKAAGVVLAVGLFVLVAVGCGASGPPVAELKAKRDVAGLIEALQSGGWPRECEAARALGSMGASRSVPALISALDGACPADVALALGEIGDRRAVDPLTSLVRELGVSPHRADETAQATMVALARIGDPSSVMTALQIGYLQSGVFMGRPLNAAKWLGVMGKPAAPTLLAVLLGNQAVPAFPPETGILGTTREMRLLTASALGQIGHLPPISRAASALKKRLGTKDWKESSELLALIYRKHTPEVLRLLRERGTVRVYWGLIRIGQRSALPALERAIGDLGTTAMALDYLNSGNDRLDAAATKWAIAHNYQVNTWVQVTPGASGSEPEGWGTLK